MLLTALAGCYGNVFAVALDYRIDRTIVPAVRISPPLGPGGVARQLDALVLSPWPTRPPEWEVCGLSADRQVAVDAPCFEEDALVQPVGTGDGVTWTPPTLTWPCDPETHSGLDLEPCQSLVPIRVRAASDHDEGQAIAWAEVLSPDAPPVPDPLPVGVVVVQLLDGRPAAGATLELEATVAGDRRAQVFRWYVDDGRLDGTGRTLPYETNGLVTSSRNVLHVPEEYQGPLRVFVVAAIDDTFTWGSTTLTVDSP